MAFTVDEKVTLAAALDAIGIHQIQVGYPTAEGLATVVRLKDEGCRAPLELLCPVFVAGWDEHLAASVAAGVDVVQILLRSSDEMLAVNGFTRAQAVRRLHDAVAKSVQLGAPITVFAASFSTQADGAFLLELLHAAESAGAQRVSLADSTGIARPDHIGQLVRAVTSAVQVPVAIHCHDDFGLATACTLAGLEAGARWADVSVLGIGERAGNASLEQVAAASRLSYGLDVGIDVSQLTSLCALVSQLAGRQIAPDKPIVGENVFTQQLDIHVEAAQQRPGLLEPFDPGLVGGTRQLRLGKGSGPVALRQKLHELGCVVDDETVTALTRWVTATAERYKCAVNDADLLAAIGRASAVEFGG